jgi:hypothetical protein
MTNRERKERQRVTDYIWSNPARRRAFDFAVRKLGDYLDDVDRRPGNDRLAVMDGQWSSYFRLS